jgi:peroxiredoxin
MLGGVILPGAHAASTAGREGLLTRGAEAPAFHLPDVVSGRLVSLDDFADKPALLVAILCRHCPYVQHVKDGVAQLVRDYAGAPLGIVAISANDVQAYPDDAPERLKEMAESAGFIFPLLYDETQEAATAYTTVATPDFFLFDHQRRLVYRGQFDDSRPGDGKPITGRDLRAAIDAVLAERPVASKQSPSFGCSIKWKPGRTPAYLR